jgi:hypothetical protein
VNKSWSPNALFLNKLIEGYRLVNMDGQPMDEDGKKEGPVEI